MRASRGSSWLVTPERTECFPHRFLETSLHVSERMSVSTSTRGIHKRTLHRLSFRLQRRNLLGPGIAALSATLPPSLPHFFVAESPPFASPLYCGCPSRRLRSPSRAAASADPLVN